MYSKVRRRTFQYSPIARAPPSLLQSDPRYQYIHVTRDDHKLLGEAALKFYDDRQFADNYTADFINSHLEDEIIPDILIEVLDDMSKQVDMVQRIFCSHVSGFVDILLVSIVQIFCLFNICEAKSRVVGV